MQVVVSKTIIKHGAEEEIMRIQANRTPFKEVLLLQETYDESLTIKLISSCEEESGGRFKLEIEFETVNLWPFHLMQAFEQGGYIVVSHMYDYDGTSAFVYACGEAFQVPNWIAHTELLLGAHKHKTL